MPIRIDDPPPGLQDPDALDPLRWLDQILSMQMGVDPRIPRLRPLLRAEDDAALASVVDVWPEVLGSEVDSLLDTLDTTAHQTRNVDLKRQVATARTRLAAAREADPLGTALARFLEAQTSKAALEAVGASPILQVWRAVERLAGIAAHVQARGDDRAARRYRYYQCRLARWLYLSPGVPAPVPPSSRWSSFVEQYVFGRQAAALLQAIDAAASSGEPDVAALLQAVREQDGPAVERLAGELESRFWCEQRAEEALAVGYLQQAFQMG